MHKKLLALLLFAISGVILLSYFLGGHYLSGGMMQDAPMCYGIHFITGQTRGLDSYSENYCIGILAVQKREITHTYTR